MTKLNVENQESTLYDVIIIGGGQSALACGFYWRRTNLNYIILDEQAETGGAWNHGWDSLSLFSPGEFSSLPGFMFPKSENYYPSDVDGCVLFDVASEMYIAKELGKTLDISSFNRANIVMVPPVDAKYFVPEQDADDT